MPINNKQLLQRFVPRRNNGEAVQLMDVDWKLPDTFLITLTNEERCAIIRLLEKEIGDELILGSTGRNIQDAGSNPAISTLLK